MLDKDKSPETNSDKPSSELLDGVELYLQHCSQCHGVAGDGLGRAAIQLTPAPRSFTGESMRYVSASNRLATDDDLRETISKGLQGAKHACIHIAPFRTDRRNHRSRAAIPTIGLERTFAATGSDAAKKQSWIRQRMEPTAPMDLPPFCQANQLKR